MIVNWSVRNTYFKEAAVGQHAFILTKLDTKQSGNIFKRGEVKNTPYFHPTGILSVL